MVLFLDARIPVVFGDVASVNPDDAVLLDTDGAAPVAAAVARITPAAVSHPAGCACCLPRGKVAEALGALFLARVRGEVGFFRRVVICVQDQAAIRAALTEDALVSARFRAD
jgi:hypothetical protein